MTRKTRSGLCVLKSYDVAADDKKRISLREATAKYYHVTFLSNGNYVLQPRVLVPPQAVSRRSLKMLHESVANLRKGVASDPIDLSKFAKE
jgi:hypothetical protein